jgi:hypothetical protein
MASIRKVFLTCLSLTAAVLFAGSAFADVAPPEDETCDGSREGYECFENVGCESGFCVDEDDQEVACQLECVSGNCRVCDNDDAGPPDDDAGPEGDADAAAIFTTDGGCNVGGNPVSAVGPVVIALLVPLVVFGLRRRG